MELTELTAPQELHPSALETDSLRGDHRGKHGERWGLYLSASKRPRGGIASSKGTGVASSVCAMGTGVEMGSKEQ